MQVHSNQNYGFATTLLTGSCFRNVCVPPGWISWTNVRAIVLVASRLCLDTSVHMLWLCENDTLDIKFAVTIRIATLSLKGVM